MLIAWPQYAIAQVASLAAICLKLFSASSYQNECSSATPRSNWLCAALEQELGKETFPSFSVPSAEWWCSCPHNFIAAKTTTEQSNKDRFIVSPSANVRPFCARPVFSDDFWSTMVFRLYQRLPRARPERM